MNKDTRKAQFLPYRLRKDSPRKILLYDVSSYAEDPYDRLSPFYPHGDIPIPGMEGHASDSVEGIWQGLKVIRGRIEPRFFRGGGQKRGGGKPAGHQFGNQLLGYVEARRRIYVPAYEWMLEHSLDVAISSAFIARARLGVSQSFHDVGKNGDIDNTNAALAHAAVLVEYLNRKLDAGVLTEEQSADPRTSRCAAMARSVNALAAATWLPSDVEGLILDACIALRDRGLRQLTPYDDPVLATAEDRWEKANGSLARLHLRYVNRGESSSHVLFIHRILELLQALWRSFEPGATSSEEVQDRAGALVGVEPRAKGLFRELLVSADGGFA